MFYNLLSVSTILTSPHASSNAVQWQNPRATAIAYLTSVAIIFASRYLPVLRYLFKGLYLSLGGGWMTSRAMLTADFIK